MNRRSALAFLSACAIAGLSAAAQSSPPARRDDSSVRNRLLGNWKLMSYVVFDASGAKRPGNYDVGRLVYDSSDEMSAHLMRSKRPVANPTTDAARGEAYLSYIGYFGPFTVDEVKGSVTHHVIGSSYPHWAGTDQVRYYTLSQDGRHLTLTTKAGDRITGSLDWERVQ